MAVAIPTTCPRGHEGQIGLFCQICGVYIPDETGTVERVTHTRRFFGTNWLEGLLFILTLGVGWFIWLAFTASTAQTPAKRLLNVYILDVNTGQPVSAGKVWVRDVLVKEVLVIFVTAIIGVAALANAIWVLVDKNRQALHDKVAGTIVVYAPLGLPEHLRSPYEFAGAGAGAGYAGSSSVKDTGEQLRELVRLRDEGIITPEEYERKRGELAGKL